MNDKWVETTLGQSTEITIGRTPPRKEGKYWTDDLTHPFCTIADMDGSVIDPIREGVSEQAIIDGKAKMVPAGSLLMSFKLTIGRVGFAARDLYPNEAIAWIRSTDPLLDERYLGLWLSRQDLTVGSGRAVKGATLNGESLRAIRVQVPPLSVQRRIVDLLAHLDNHLANLQTEIDTVASVLQQIPVPKVTSRSHPLGGRVRARGGKRMPKGTPFADAETEHPYLRVVDIVDGSFSYENLEFVPDSVFPAIQRYTVKSGDVVISIVGTIGRVGIVPDWADGANLTENAAVVDVLTDDLDRNWLAAWLQSPAGQREIQRVTVGTSQGKLALSRIPLMEIPEIPIEDQFVLAEASAASFTLMRTLRAERASLLTTRGELLQGLLSGTLGLPPQYDELTSEVA